MSIYVPILRFIIYVCLMLALVTNFRIRPIIITFVVISKYSQLLHLFLYCFVWEVQQLSCWILIEPVLGGVNGSFQLTVPSMNRLNQTKPATFSSCCVELSIEILTFSSPYPHETQLVQSCAESSFLETFLNMQFLKIP
jgi:hypothetical protein